MNPKSVLVATLGVNPQIVTITLDMLRMKHYTIQEVVLVHTGEARIMAALHRLTTELDRLGGPTYRPVLITGPAGPLATFHTETDITALLRTLYQVLEQCKKAGQQVHLLISGGAKVMSAYALVVAQLLFDSQDRAWHLFSEWRPGDAIRMHLEPGEPATLVPVPVISLPPSARMAMLQETGADPAQVIAAQQALIARQERQLELDRFLHRLSPAKQRVLRLLAEGLSNNDIVDRRGTSWSTVTKQLSDIYAEWRNTFGLDEDASVRDQIVVEMSAYFADQ